MTALFSPDTSGAAETLIDLLSRQKSLYVDLSDLSRQQGGLIREGQTETLLTLLARRQGLVDELGTLAQRIAPYRTQIPEIAEAAPEGQRQLLRSLVADVQQLLEAIIAQDDQDRAQLAAARDAVRTESQRLTRTGTAMNAYRAARPPVASRLTDHQG